MTVETKPTVDDPNAFRWRKFLGNSLAGWFFMWLGITIAGGLFGTCLFPIVGTIFGLVLAGMAGSVTSVLGIGLHIALRGRLPLRVSASFAGATAGFASWGINGEGAVLSPTVDMLPFQLVTAQLGSLGAVIATSVVLRVLGRMRLASAVRSGQFSIADLLLFTAWLATVLTAYRIWLGPDEHAAHVELVFVGVIGAAMLVTELLCRAYRKALLSPKKSVAETATLPSQGSEPADLDKFTQPADSQ